MSEERELLILEDLVSICCVVEYGLSDTVMDAATTAGAHGATVHVGTGIGLRERFRKLEWALNTEREIIRIIVSRELCDDVIKAISQAAKLDEPGRGIVFTTPIEKLATCRLDDSE